MRTLSSDKVHTLFRAAIALTLFSTSWMKLIKLRQKKWEDLKQTKSPVGEKQHPQDGGEAAASLCLCRKWQNAQGEGGSPGWAPAQGRAKEPFPAGKVMWGGGNSPAGWGCVIAVGSAAMKLCPPGAAPRAALTKGTECISARHFPLCPSQTLLLLPSTLQSTWKIIFFQMFLLRAQ